MKTLDEVIKAIDFCKSGNLSKCKDCPYIGTCELDYAVLSDDALHYLWKYRTEQNILRDRKEHYEYWEHKYYAELEKNDPLDWEQLKQMVGKPVWVEGAEHPETGAWYLIQKVDALVWLRTSYGDWVTLHKPTHGTGWQAYRKERK